MKVDRCSKCKDKDWIPFFKDGVQIKTVCLNCGYEKEVKKELHIKV